MQSFDHRAEELGEMPRMQQMNTMQQWYGQDRCSVEILASNRMSLNTLIILSELSLTCSAISCTAGGLQF
eukprot:10615729-Karenia_brevis.AAC.1